MRAGRIISDSPRVVKILSLQGFGSHFNDDFATLNILREKLLENPNIVSTAGIQNQSMYLEIVNNGSAWNRTILLQRYVLNLLAHHE